MIHDCGQFHEDKWFTSEAKAYYLPIRRYVCPHGIDRIIEPPVEQRGALMHEKKRACSYCGEPLMLPSERRLHERCKQRNREELEDARQVGMKEITTRGSRKRMASETW